MAFNLINKRNNAKQRRHFRFLLKCIFFYLIIVLGSGFVFWGLFNYDTTHFVVTEQMNRRLRIGNGYMDPEKDLVSYHKDSKDQIPLTMPDFNVLVAPEFRKWDSINGVIQLDNEHLNAIHLTLDSVRVIADSLRSESIDVYRRKELSDYQSRIDSMNDFLEKHDSTKMIIEGKYIELAQLKYEYAVKIAEMQAYIVERWGLFIPDTLLNRITQLVDSTIKLNEDVLNNENYRRELMSSLRESINAFHRNRVETVGFWDFVYYSFCVSTTVSFGDIAPNSTITRIFTVLEILACLVLIGVIIDRIVRVIGFKRK